MSISLSSKIAHLQLCIAPTGEQQIRRPCGRCKSRQVFTNSGKFRVNANGKAIDIWLIYRCTACDQTWNHAIHERRAVSTFMADELNRFSQNDGALARHYARDLDRLRANGAEISATERVTVERVVLLPVTAATEAIDISLALQETCRVRLDRVLAAGLNLRRRAVAMFFAQAVIAGQNVSTKVLKRAAVDGQVIRLNLAPWAEMPTALLRALNGDDESALVDC